LGGTAPIDEFLERESLQADRMMSRPAVSDLLAYIDSLSPQSAPKYTAKKQ
jgi:hypothetical protein